MIRAIGTVLIMGGLMAAAGSAGDCDGACGPGNTLSEMLTIIGFSVMAMIVGACMVIGKES